MMLMPHAFENIHLFDVWQSTEHLSALKTTKHHYEVDAEYTAAEREKDLAKEMAEYQARLNQGRQAEGAQEDVAE